MEQPEPNMSMKQLVSHVKAGRALSQQFGPYLFHGTNANIVGKEINPGHGENGEDSAWASTHPEHAAEFGKRIYKVVPKDWAETETHDTMYNEAHTDEDANPEDYTYAFSSRKGFKIIGEHNPIRKKSKK